ncbi:MAG TPA: STAS domain-containing protein [Armatimonadota bacterium]|nr:STAS domain-containing protein [Armatimonadota bacterium]HOM71238.1 STAS domain-containing protein [Armatimonadota bacterium]HOP80511.1 STAS domain-containing protein [Armatimonadota bacterium]HPP75455.1 STAS domain-containing protein [Armatimonadota bacterium]
MFPGLTEGIGKMAITTSQTTEEVVVKVIGDLDLTTVGEFQAVVDKALDAKDNRRLVIDLRETDYIDSAGLEQLLVVNRKLIPKGDRILVRVEPGKQPQSVLSITGFGAVMDIEPLPGT